MHRELGSSGLVTFFMQKMQFIYKKNTTPLLGQNNSILINNYFDYLDSHNPTIVFFWELTQKYFLDHSWRKGVKTL